MLELILTALFSRPTIDALKKTPELLPNTEIHESYKIPRKKETAIAPILEDGENMATLAIDMDTEKILYEKNIDIPLPIASLSKLMTVLIILENHDLEEVVTIPPEVSEIKDTKINIAPGESFLLRTLLEATLISSANDTALALAIYDAKTEEAFVKKMNLRAKSLGLFSAEFINPTGLDKFISDGKESFFSIGNKMSARDLAKLAKRVTKNEFVRETVKKQIFTGTSLSGRSFEKTSTNQLLGTFLNISGLKTGYTPLAKECLISIGTSPDGHEIMTIVLGSTDRFSKTKKLMSWIYDNYVWE